MFVIRSKRANVILNAVKDLRHLAQDQSTRDPSLRSG